MRVSKVLTLLACLVAMAWTPAEAGEVSIGKIISATGADTTNATTATPFFVPTNTQITVWCTAQVYFLTDSSVAVTDATGTKPGLPLVAFEKHPNSTGSMVITFGTGTAADGGAIIRAAGPAGFTCVVYTRKGNEG